MQMLGNTTASPSIYTARKLKRWWRVALSLLRLTALPYVCCALLRLLHLLLHWLLCVALLRLLLHRLLLHRLLRVALLLHRLLLLLRLLRILRVLPRIRASVPALLLLLSTAAATVALHLCCSPAQRRRDFLSVKLPVSALVALLILKTA